MQRPFSAVLRFLYGNSLLLVFAVLVPGTPAGQALTGWHDHNNDQQELGLAALSFGAYLRLGHFLEATFENWESGFLQVALYMLLTVWLRQRGPSESKPVDATYGATGK